MSTDQTALRRAVQAMQEGLPRRDPDLHGWLTQLPFDKQVDLVRETVDAYLRAKIVTAVEENGEP